MKFKSLSLVLFCIFATTTWAQTYMVNEETFSQPLEIKAQVYDTILFVNSRFENVVTIAKNEKLRTIMIVNSNFENSLSIEGNPSIVTLSIGGNSFNRNLSIIRNNIEGEAILNSNIISGLLRFSENQIGERCGISNSRVERDFSCFENIFASIFQINTSNFGLRSVLYGNAFTKFELNNASFDMLLMQNNYLEKSIGFADCIINGHLTINKVNDIGSSEKMSSIDFSNTVVYGSVYFENIDETVLLYNLWQLDFFQDIIIGYDRLTSSIGLVSNRVVHSPQSIEHIFISNPYKELSAENVQRFKQIFPRIMNGFDRRGERDSKINFTKWKYHYENSFNNPLVRILNIIWFYASFGLFLNILAPIVISLGICIIFMFIYLMPNKMNDNKPKFIYLKIDNFNNYFKRYLIALLVSTSIFCNLPMATKKLREDNAKNITWVQGILGTVMLMIIAAIVGRIATL